MVSVTMAAPLAVHISAIYWACRSVGKPGYGSVIASAPTRSRSWAEIRTLPLVPVDANTRLLHQLQQGLEERRLDTSQFNLAAGDRRSNRISTGFDPVGDHSVICPVHFRNPLDGQHIGPNAVDVRAHCDQ